MKYKLNMNKSVTTENLEMHVIFSLKRKYGLIYDPKVELWKVLRKKLIFLNLKDFEHLCLYLDSPCQNVSNTSWLVSGYV